MANALSRKVATKKQIDLEEDRQGKLASITTKTPTLYEQVNETCEGDVQFQQICGTKVDYGEKLATKFI